MEDLISSIVKTIASCPPVMMLAACAHARTQAMLALHAHMTQAMLARVNNWVALLEPFQQRQPDS